MSAGSPGATTRRAAAVAACWGAAVAASAWLDGRVDLGSQALPLVAAAAASGIWWSAPAAMACCVAAVLAFNWSFVPPRGTLAVELPQHVLLLATMLGVSGTVALLTARQRQSAQRERRQRERAAQIHELAERLRAAPDATAALAALCDALAAPWPAGRSGVAVMSNGDPAEGAGADATATLGALDDDERAGLRLCAAEGRAFGAGSARYAHLAAWYLPLRGRSGCFGAALLRLDADGADDDGLRQHAQALCDQCGLALERARALAAAASAREQAQAHSTRNTLLAAVAHDFRTPLATLVGAASSLLEQDDRLPDAQRRRLAETILDEAAHLGRMTDNALQLARLSAPGVALRLDWQSCEEIVGSVLRRVRRRAGAARVRARVEPGLPLLRADAVLLVQLLDNLIDNALKYCPDPSPIELRVHRAGHELVLAVRDRGPGVAPGERERLFEPYTRGAAGDGATAAQQGRPRGAGVGLAVCRAIARAHGGEIRCRARGHGGSAFECRLPVSPDAPAPGDPGPAAP